MNVKAMKERWVGNLKSRYYKSRKGRYTFCRQDKPGEFNFCALGVLMDTELVGEWVLPIDTSSVMAFRQDWSSIPEEKRYLPPSVQLGLSRDELESVVFLSDDNSSFDKVIKYIEDNI